MLCGNALEVGQKLIEVSTANGWEAPYFIGADTNTFQAYHNQTLRDKYPDRYIGQISFKDSPLVAELVPGSDLQVSVLDAIDSKLEPPQNK